MKRPTFFSGIAIALGLAVLGSGTFFGLPLLIGSLGVLTLSLSCVGGIYILYLLTASQQKTGRLTVAFLWLVVTAAAWTFTSSIFVFFGVQVALVWLIRSAYYYRSVICAIGDIFLCGFSTLIAVAVAIHTSSVFLSVWSFFLCQALFIYIPGDFISKQSPFKHHAQDRFSRANRAAETALRRAHSLNR